MANGNFSLSVSSRGNDFIIGGSGALDVEGIASLRQSVEESCKKEGASVMLDLMMVSELRPEAIVHLVGVAEFCRGLGVPFTVSVNHDLIRILKESGYDAELLPIVAGR